MQEDKSRVASSMIPEDISPDKRSFVDNSYISDQTPMVEKKDTVFLT